MTYRTLVLLILLMFFFDARAGTISYIYTDYQGSVVGEADVHGNFIAAFDYKPYGAQALGSALSGPSYTGHVSDPDSGLIYMQARYFDPSIGRFISTDPVRPSAGHLFAFSRYKYAYDNPYKFVDMDGRYESPALFLATVPGQGSFDAGMTSLEGGEYGMATVHFGAMIGEQVLSVLTLGQGQATTFAARNLAVKATLSGEAAGGRAATSALKQTGDITSKQAARGIRSLEKEIVKHEKKIAEFRANPTVKPGMEGMSKEAIQKQQEARIRHLEGEIETFKKNIQKLTEKLDN